MPRPLPWADKGLPIRFLIACWIVSFAGDIRPDVLRRGLGPEPDSLHIHQAQGLSAVNLLRDIREGLVTFNQAGEPVPGQAGRPA